MKAMDTNNDGMISKEEFNKYHETVWQKVKRNAKGLRHGGGHRRGVRAGHRSERDSRPTGRKSKAVSSAYAQCARSRPWQQATAGFFNSI